MAAADHTSVPRPALIGAAALVALSLAAAVAGRVGGPAAPSASEAPAAIGADLVFTDRADGAVVVTGAGRETVLDGGTNGFIRGVLRGLARDRRMRGIGEDAPFHLVLHTDGRLSLTDEATGRTLDLDAFGPTNTEAFARLLPR